MPVAWRASVDAMKTPAPGLYTDVSYDDYENWDAVRASTLKHFDRSALHARHEMIHAPKETPALKFGHAFHTAILEPEKFATQYIVSPKVDGRTSRGKQLNAEFEAKRAALGALGITDYESSQMDAMRSAVMAHPLAKLLIEGAGKNEVSGLWVDPETGELCKLRADRLALMYGYSVVIDLKSADDASRPTFSKAIANYRYAEQAAFYLDGLNVLGPCERRFVFIVVEKEEPYGVAVYELAPEGIEAGRRRVRRHLEMYAKAKKSNVWPGYSDGLEPISLPMWALREDA